jgi:DNA-binding phage protein
MPAYRDYRTTLIEALRENPEDCRVYLEVSLEEYGKDGDGGALLLALDAIIEAQGGIARVAEAANVNQRTISRALSGQGNLRLKTLCAIVRGLGYRIAIEPVDREPSGLE